MAGEAGLMRAGGPDAPWVLGHTIHPARPIVFQTAKPELTPEMAPVLAALAEFMAANPTLGPVEVGVHVAANGHRQREHWLSNRRAYTIVQALVAYGVEPKRLLARGYGPEMPVDTNDTPEGRANNRRVELRVVATFERPTHGPGGPRAPSEATPPPQREWNAPGEVVLRPSTPIVFVAYKTRLTPEAEAPVAELAERLRANPAWRRVEVGVHTDGTGAPGYKLRLSQQRAKVVREALIRLGIEAERLVPKGYGGTRRIRPDRRPADRATNRRVELRVLEDGGLSMLLPGVRR